jgi:recombination protein RecR
MNSFPNALENLIDKFASLPGIGLKSAQRLAFYMLTLPEAEIRAFADAINLASESVQLCEVCQNLSDDAVCPVCKSPVRDNTLICVVADPKSVLAFERAGEYKGTYHVLHGVISPMKHIGPEDIKIKELISRAASGNIAEVIMATDPDTEGETTARYIGGLIKPFGIKVTRLAYGIPVGSSLEFADEATLMRAIDGRREI